MRIFLQLFQLDMIMYNKKKGVAKKYFKEFESSTMYVKRTKLIISLYYTLT